MAELCGIDIFMADGIYQPFKDSKFQLRLRQILYKMMPMSALKRKWYRVLDGRIRQTDRQLSVFSTPRMRILAWSQMAFISGQHPLFFS